MINLENSNFFLPTKQFRELSILLVIMHNSGLSQKSIAQQTDLSGAMVNGYIKNLTSRDLVRVQSKNQRDKEYFLTENGKETLMSSLMHCSAEIVALYSQSRHEVLYRFKNFFDGTSIHKVVIYGAANTAHLVCSVLEEFRNIVISAIVDNDNKRWGKLIGNYVIQPAHMLDELDFDCVVISSFARQNEIYNSLKYLEQEGITLVQLTSLEFYANGKGN